MDDKLKKFLNDEEDHTNTEGINDDDTSKKQHKKERNKYDDFFGADKDELIDKVKDGLEDAGEFVKKSMKETSEFLDESLKETGRFFKEGSAGAKKIIEEDIIPKAKESKKKLDKKVDDWTEKLKEYHESPIKKTEGSDLDDGLFDTHDSFFSKMEKFADKMENKDKKERPDVEMKKVKKKDKPKDNRPIAGFEDWDGDGDELIDDAIIDDE